MKISKEQVQHVASLARLCLTESEVDRLQNEMGGMIAFADQLSDLDVRDTAPTTHAIEMTNVFREDVMAPSPDRETILNNAPRRDEAAVVVPRVVE